MQPWHKPQIRSICWDGKRNGVSARMFLEEGVKRCPRCGQIKLFSDFTKRGKYCVSRCQECMSEIYYENADDIREIRREHRIGVSPGTYELLIALHGEVCAICGADKPGGKGAANNQFCIDHDHETGKIRGLLCTSCNVGIGMLRHNTELLNAAIDYLSRPDYSIEQLKAQISLLNFSSKSAEELDLF